jgi:hypothetical protein
MEQLPNSVPKKTTHGTPNAQTCAWKEYIAYMHAFAKSIVSKIIPLILLRRMHEQLASEKYRAGPESSRAV